MGIFDVLLQSKADTAYWKDCAIKAQRELQSVERRLLTVQEEGAIQALNMEGLHAIAARLTTERDAAIARAEAEAAQARALREEWHKERTAHAATRAEFEKYRLVSDSDYVAMRAERDALREEVARLNNSTTWLKDRDEAVATMQNANAERDALREERDSLKAEIAMLRGVDCGVDGDGPCGVCIKCARNSVDWCDAKFNGQGDE